MDSPNLFTVKILEIKANSNIPGGECQVNSREIEQFPNMLNAGILKGRIVELEHSRLVGRSVKFKTVINYDRYLGPNETLGLTFVPKQDRTE